MAAKRNDCGPACEELHNGGSLERAEGPSPCHGRGSRYGLLGKVLRAWARVTVRGEGLGGCARVDAIERGLILNEGPERVIGDASDGQRAAIDEQGGGLSDVGGVGELDVVVDLDDGGRVAGAVGDLGRVESGAGYGRLEQGVVGGWG